MTAATPPATSRVRRRGRRNRPPWVAVVTYALQACVPARRRAVLALPTLVAVGFGALARGVTDEIAFAQIAGSALYPLVLPLTCLVVGDAVLGAEVRAGTMSFTWASPVKPVTITLGRWLAGWFVASASLVPAFAAAALVAGAPASVGPVALGAVAGAAAHVALFVAIGCIVRRAAIWSLVVVFLVERLLGDAVTGIAQLSPTWEAQAVFTGLADGVAAEVRDGIPQGWSAVARLALVAGACLAVASWRMRRLRLTGPGE